MSGARHSVASVTQSAKEMCWDCQINGLNSYPCDIDIVGMGVADVRL